MKEFLEQVIAGIAAGGIYASLALALVLIYRAMGLINFAQGEFAMFTAFICWSMLQGPQLPFGVAVVIAVLLGAVAAFCIERLVVRPFERGAPLAIIIVTLALFEITNSVAGFIWGYTPRSFPSPFPARPVEVGGINISIQDAAVIAVSLLTLLLLYLLFNRTKLGLAMRAAAMYPEVSALLGVRTGLMLVSCSSPT
jgi:branched-chain amino acid transport system permease protein